jgi:hypothetical protein
LPRFKKNDHVEKKINRQTEKSMSILLSDKDSEEWIRDFEVWNSDFKNEFLHRMSPFGWTERVQDNKLWVECPPKNWKIYRSRHTPFLYPTLKPLWNPLYTIYYRNIHVATVKVYVLAYDSAYTLNFTEEKLRMIDVMEDSAPFPDIIRSLILDFIA